MKKLLLSFLIIIIHNIGYSQQVGLYNQFYESYMLFSPAFIPTDILINSNYHHQVGITHRNQWNKMDGAPETYLVRYAFADPFSDRGNLKLPKWLGGTRTKKDIPLHFGGHIFSDKLGDTETFSGFLKYAFSLKSKNEQHILNLGIGAGFTHYRLKSVLFESPSTANDPKLIELLSNEFQNVKFFNASMGAFYAFRFETGQKHSLIYFSASTPQTVGLDFGSTYRDGLMSNRIYHWYFASGTSLQLSNQWTIGLSTWTRHVRDISGFQGTIHSRLEYRGGQNNELGAWFGSGINRTFGSVMNNGVGDSSVYGEMGFAFGMETWLVKLSATLEVPIGGMAHFFGNSTELNATFMYGLD